MKAWRILSFAFPLSLFLLAGTALPAFALEPPSPPAYGIRLENTWIPMKDGVRLAVTLYMPDGAKTDDKFPAVLEYNPYRKDDGTAQRDYGLYSYFVRRGYVCARVDIRGFGNSEGTPTDREYRSRNSSTACRSSPGSPIRAGPTVMWA